MKLTTAKKYAQIVLNDKWKNDNFQVTVGDLKKALNVQRAFEHYGCLVLREQSRLIVSVPQESDSELVLR